MLTANPRTPTKWEVVVLALADVGGAAHVVDTEDVAMRVYELSPDAFSWRKYPDQIDLDSVRVSLTDACKPKYGALAAGSVREGWHLSPAGVEWEARNAPSLRPALAVASPSTRPETRLETLHAAREAARVKASPAFRSWIEGGEVLPKNAAAAFRVDSYTSSRERSLKLNRVGEIAKELADVDLRRFVEEVTPMVLAVEGIPPIMNRNRE